MAEYKMSTPISEEKIRSLRVGDTVFVSGNIITARDEAHRRAIEWIREGRPLPINVSGLALYHCGPIARKNNGTWKIIAAGPTTSSRMEMYESDFLKNFGVRIVIGKGGMGPKTTGAMKEYGAVYGAYPGGAGALAADAIIEVEDVKWLDLGMPEALWHLKVENFGPVIVTIDSHGNNLYLNLMEKFEKNIERMIQRL